MLGALVAAMGADRYMVRQAVRSGSRLGGEIGWKSYSVAEENEADYIGTYIMSRAGYDPSGAAILFDKLGQLNPRAVDGASFGSTHPSSPEREARNVKIREEIAMKRVLGLNMLPSRRSPVPKEDCEESSDRPGCS